MSKFVRLLWWQVKSFSIRFHKSYISQKSKITSILRNIPVIWFGLLCLAFYFALFCLCASRAKSVNLVFWLDVTAHKHILYTHRECQFKIPHMCYTPLIIRQMLQNWFFFFAYCMECFAKIHIILCNLRFFMRGFGFLPFK